MKKNLFLSTAFLCVALLFINATSKIPAPTINATIFSKQKTLTRADVEKQIGRKLNFKERIGWLVAKKQMNQLIANEPAKEVNENAILGLIFGFLIPPIGILFSLIALSQINKNPEKYTGKNMATAGLIIGILYIILIIIATVAISSAISMGCNSCYLYK